MTGFKRYEEKQIDPENIWVNDAFGTLQQYADFLTKSLTESHHNFVLNVNGSWGIGKSFFVKRWAADLRKQYPVVEYNAWENDSEDVPLSVLVVTTPTMSS